MGRTQTIDGVEVQYHSDGFRDSRPAINVKHNVWLDRGEQAETIAKLTAELGERWIGDGSYQSGALSEAIEDAQRDWWEQAAEAAKGYGLGPIEQEGRSGGWLVFTDGRDPEDMAAGIEDDEHEPSESNPDGEPCEWVDEARTELSEWLAGYSKMVAWCKATINGGEVPQYRDTLPFGGEGQHELATDPDAALVGPYTSEGIDADILFRLNDLADLERERRSETLATRTFTEKSLREALYGAEPHPISRGDAKALAAFVFGGEEHMKVAQRDEIMDGYADWTLADAEAAEKVTVPA